MTEANDNGYILWRRSGELNRRATQLRKSSGISGGDIRAYRAGRLSGDYAARVGAHVEEIDGLHREAQDCRNRSNALLAALREADQRKKLDPKVDVIPAGAYPKLAACVTYPLRQSCDRGEDKDSRWERCEFMKYATSRSVGFVQPGVWTCTAPRVG